MNREQLQKHWKEIEAFKNGAEIETLLGKHWVTSDDPAFKIHSLYRIKNPMPKVDWSRIPDWHHWVAMEENRIAFSFENEPSLRTSYTVWFNSGQILKLPPEIFQFKGDWKESKVQRPKKG